MDADQLHKRIGNQNKSQRLVTVLARMDLAASFYLI